MSARVSPRECLPSGEGGFVLPVALLVLVLLSMVSATGLYTSRSDFRAAEATREAALALAAADAGAARTVALWAQHVSALPAAGDSLVVDWLTLPDGSQYRSVVRRAPVGAGGTASNVVLVRTTGVVRPPGTARRTVVTVVEVTGGGGSLCCEAAFKVQGSLRISSPGKSRPESRISGADAVPPGWGGAQCPDPLSDLPGVVTSDATGVDVRNGGTILGSPPTLEDTTVADADFTDFGSVTYASLASVADFTFPGGTRLRDVVGPVVAGGTCSTGVSTNWGSPWTPGGPCGSWMPIVHVTGNLTLSGAGQGQGILLVDGDLTIDGSLDYYGLVIVQGSLRLTAVGRIFGAILIRGGVGGTKRSDITGGGTIQYSGCAARRAQAAIPEAASSGGTPGAGASGAKERSWFEVVG